MKKILLYTAILLVVGLALVYAQNSMKNPKKTVIKELAEIYDDYGDTFFESLFSLEELRPYSILQVDKVIDNYDNNSWISYSEISAKLKSNDKSNLLIQINEFILNQEVKENQERILNTIRVWCIAKSQFNFLSGKMKYSYSELIEKSKKLLNSKEESKLNIVSEKMEIQGYQVLNAISKMNKYQQMEFFSGLYMELANSEKNSNN